MMSPPGTLILASLATLFALAGFAQPPVTESFEKGECYYLTSKDKGAEPTLLRLHETGEADFIQTWYSYEVGTGTWQREGSTITVHNRAPDAAPKSEPEPAVVFRGELTRKRLKGVWKNRSKEFEMQGEKVEYEKTTFPLQKDEAVLVVQCLAERTEPRIPPGEEKPKTVEGYLKYHKKEQLRGTGSHHLLRVLAPKAHAGKLMGSHNCWPELWGLEFAEGERYLMRVYGRELPMLLEKDQLGFPACGDSLVGMIKLNPFHHPRFPMDATLKKEVGALLEALTPIPNPAPASRIP